MRDIKKIVIHTTATFEGKPFDAKAIDAMHRRMGWKMIGYHWVVLLDGTIEKGRDEEMVGSHVRGHNTNSIGVVYVGGLGRDGKGRIVAKDTRTCEQKVALAKLIHELSKRYPTAVIMGHRDLSPDKDGDGVVERHEWLKECPCFTVKDWLKEIGLGNRAG